MLLSFVTLKVFVVLGREVATLVNEQKSIGTYKLTWNTVSVAGGLTSGVYFYHIQADEPTHQILEHPQPVLQSTERGLHICNRKLKHCRANLNRSREYILNLNSNLNLNLNDNLSFRGSLVLIKIMSKNMSKRMMMR